MKITAIIPARGGSKSIKDKNIVDFCNKPLIAYSIDHALKSKYIDRVIVSTDSEIIANIAKQYGAEVPFIRPLELAQDDTLDLPVIKHCLDYLNRNEKYIPDIVVHLRPTSPLRTPKMVDDAIRMLIENDEASSIRCVCEPAQNPFKMWTLNKDGFIQPLINSNITEAYNQPRQALPNVLWQNGYIDVVRYETITEGRSITGNKILPLTVDSENIIDIDNHITLKLAEYIYQSQKSEDR
jgi:CMP-N,N'-diacetyllegionaminic acid synthase